jgi:signal transduction histidine kinase
VRRALTLPRSDLLLAAGVAAGAAAEITLNHALQPRGAAAATELAAAAALAWRRRAPLAATTVVAWALALEATLGVPLQEPLVPLMAIVVMAYSLGAYARLERVLAGAAILVAADVVSATSQDQTGFGNVVFGIIFFGGALLLGRVTRARANRAAELEARAADLERRQEERSREAAAAERVRIARDLHDVIAHSVSVMVVQAGAAEEVLRRDPERAVEPIRSVQVTGRDAIAELGRLLGILREHGDEVGLAPQPGLDDLDGLLEETRRAGLPVELTVEGDPRRLAPGVELAIYRVVQEALTNARKHAGDARAAVMLRYGAAEVSAEVRDDGSAAKNGHGGGHGLIGMRERVAVYGGSLDATHRAEGGFAVRVRIPLDAGE